MPLPKPSFNQNQASDTQKDCIIKIVFLLQVEQFLLPEISLLPWTLKFVNEHLLLLLTWKKRAYLLLIGKLVFLSINRKISVECQLPSERVRGTRAESRSNRCLGHTISEIKSYGLLGPACYRMYHGPFKQARHTGLQLSLATHTFWATETHTSHVLT